MRLAQHANPQNPSKTSGCQEAAISHGLMSLILSPNCQPTIPPTPRQPPSSIPPFPRIGSTSPKGNIPITARSSRSPNTREPPTHSPPAPRLITTPKMRSGITNQHVQPTQSGTSRRESLDTHLLFPPFSARQPLYPSASQTIGSPNHHPNPVSVV